MKKPWKHFLNSKLIKTFLVLFLFILPILFLLLSQFSKNINQPAPTSQETRSSISTTQPLKSYNIDPWPELIVDEIELKTLMEVYTPTPSNLQLIYDWAAQFDLSSDVKCSHDWIYNHQKDITHFDWSGVGYATTGQFRLFLQFYGKPVKDPQTEQMVSGLSKFTSITFEDTDIEFDQPIFWASLAHYMPNLKTIKIKSGELDHRSLTFLPKEIGLNSFNAIEIEGENIEDRYENFLGWLDDEHKQPVPLANSLTHLIIRKSELKDHLELNPENKDDKIKYFTEEAFVNYSNLRHLQWLDLSENKLKHVKGNLINLPGIIELHLGSNLISDWHCVDVNGSEGYWDETVSPKVFRRVSDLGQICFPNPKHISFVDISDNQLTQLVQVSHNDWNNSKLALYVQTQKDLYPALNFVNISNQNVTKKLFIFGNNAGANQSDMNLDLTNIYAFPETIYSIDDKVQYISNCLNDRKNTIIDPTTQKKKQLTDTIWNNLSKTENVIPSIVNLYGQFCNYSNYYNNQERPDVILDNDKKAVEADDDLLNVNYYSKSNIVDYQPKTPNPRFLSTQTHNTIQTSTSSIAANSVGANVLRMQTSPTSGEPISEYSGHATGVAQDYDSSVQHTIDINPHFIIPEQMAPLHGLQQSKYHYDVQIFNAEQFVFYLTNILDDKGNPVINDYIKSISDKNPTIDEIYKNFWSVFTYVGDPEKQKWFNDNFNDRNFWNINFVVNNQEKREMTVSVTYPVYQYIGSTDASVKPTKLTFNIKIPMNPYVDNRLQWILTYLWIAEIIAFILLLIPLSIYWIRMKKKSKAIKAKKMKIIQQLQDQNGPKLKIQEHKTKEEKLTADEYRSQIARTGKTTKTKTVNVDDKDIKPDSSSSKAVDIDSILEEIK